MLGKGHRGAKSQTRMLVPKLPPKSAAGDGQHSIALSPPSWPGPILPSQSRDTATPHPVQSALIPHQVSTRHTASPETSPTTPESKAIPTQAPSTISPSPALSSPSQPSVSHSATSQTLDPGTNGADQFVKQLVDILYPTKTILKKYYRQGKSGHPAQLLHPDRGVIEVIRLFMQSVGATDNVSAAGQRGHCHEPHSGCGNLTFITTSA